VINNLQLIASILILTTISVWQSVYGFKEISRIKKSIYQKITLKHIVYGLYLIIYDLAYIFILIVIVYCLLFF